MSNVYIVKNAVYSVKVFSVNMKHELSNEFNNFLSLLHIVCSIVYIV